MWFSKYSLDSLLPKEKSIRWICFSVFSLGVLLFIYSLQWTLNGPHQHRQADSIYSGYFYCYESDSRFLYPRVGPRGNTEGVAINEFPIYSYTLGQICRWKQGWDEGTPRIFSVLMAILAGILFWHILTHKFNLKPKVHRGQSLFEFLLLFLFLPVNWTFFTIPMPESTALFFNALAGYLWVCHSQKGSLKVVAFFSFILSFLIRPFYILLLFFYFPGLWTMGLILVVCIGLFWFWYRHWSGQVTTLPGYFGIQFQTRQEVLANLPRAFAHLPVRILEHTAGIGLISFWLLRKKQRLLIAFYGAALGMMYLLKSTHVSAHGYYLLNAGVFASMILFLSLAELSLRQKGWFLGIFSLYTLTSTQHNFHKNGHEIEAQQALLRYLKESGERELPQNAKIATYLGMTPEWLYYYKRTGFIFEPIPIKQISRCPEGATHMLAREGVGDVVDEKAPLRLEHCP